MIQQLVSSIQFVIAPKLSFRIMEIKRKNLYKKWPVKASLFFLSMPDPIKLHTLV
jgi:hypothetical protein